MDARGAATRTIRPLYVRPANQIPVSIHRFDVWDSFEFEKIRDGQYSFGQEDSNSRHSVFALEGSARSGVASSPTGLGYVRSALRLTRELA